MFRCHPIAIVSHLMAASAIAQGALKVPNTQLNVPASPPPTAISLVNALPGLTFSAPICLRSPAGDSSRLFVCEKGGLLRVVPEVTAAVPSATTFLDLPALLASRGESINTDSESGLLSVAFHPDYQNNGNFYIFYSVNANGLHQRVSRFTRSIGNPDLADPASERILIDQADDAGNHNGGDMHFGPDGYLYISVGDEGNGDDALDNSQRITKDLFSGILRIDVDLRDGNVPPTPHPAIPLDGGAARFAIPVGNPFVSTSLGGHWDGIYNGTTIASTHTVRREFYATGLRNPWRFSFDGNELWCGDVGQNAREEVDLIENGGNYGWAYREGTIAGPKDSSAPEDFDTVSHSPPIYDYDRSTPNFNGYSITGGLVYRGTRIGSLTGKYIFADYGSGNIWSLRRNPSGPPTVVRIAGEGGIVAFGNDPSNQDLLLADIDGSRILRLVSTTQSGNFPTTLSATGLFNELANLTPAAGVIPYAVNLPFWSDHAEKSRWFIIPDGTSSFGWNRDGSWSLPSGTIWVKHFEMVMNRNAAPDEPVIRKRIETRLIVKNDAGVYGVSYRWNDQGTEATLVDDGGVEYTLDVTDQGVPASQIWHIPSRSECLTCHSSAGGYALSFNTRQLNLDNGILGISGNQLDTLRLNGYFDGSQPVSPNVLPRHVRPGESQYSVESRVRSYLAVNCSYCHQTGGTAPTRWDVRAQLTLDETALLTTSLANNGGDSANKLVVPGSPDHSILLSRVSASQGFTRMPPVATKVIDQTNVQLIRDWISGELANRSSFDTWRSQQFGSTDSPEGAADQDPDHDGSINHSEFLAGTSPLNGGDFLRPAVVSANGSLALQFSIPVNRSFSIQLSTDLQRWTPWDVPGNQGIPVAAGPVILPLPAAAGTQFLRVGISEN